MTDSPSIRALFWEASAIRETLRPQLGDQSRLTLGLEGSMVDGMYRVDVVVLLGAN